MAENLVYKVLWVEDDDSIVLGTQQDADEYGIELDRYSNWQQAENVLRNNFEDYTAIILDAYCQINPLENIKEEFIGAVLPSLVQIFGEKQKFIPWYILSAGTMNFFSHTIQGAEYQHHTNEWGQMLYIKDAPEDDSKNSRFLFENICRIGKEQTNNIVLYRHKDVFKYLGEGKLIDNEARKSLLKMLSVLYVPEENIKYEYAGNPIRKVLESIFRAARKLCLLTDDCFDKNDRMVLLDASRYLSGLNINCYSGREITHQARWGEPGAGKDGAGGDSVFPTDVSMLVKNTLNWASEDSHTYLIDEQTKELFLGYVMHLCYIIKWFGKYAEEHSNVHENRKMQKKVDVVLEDGVEKQDDLEFAKEKYLNKEFVPVRDENGFWHCEECLVPIHSWDSGGKMILIEIKYNTNPKSKKTYPYYASFGTKR